MQLSRINGLVIRKIGYQFRTLKIRLADLNESDSVSGPYFVSYFTLAMSSHFLWNVTVVCLAANERLRAMQFLGTYLTASLLVIILLVLQDRFCYTLMP